MDKKEYLKEGYIERMRAEELDIDLDENAALLAEFEAPEPSSLPLEEWE